MLSWPAGPATRAMQHHVHEVVYNDVIHNGKMESEGEIESAAPLLQDTAALPSGKRESTKDVSQ